MGTKRKLGEGETSSSPWRSSLCLRAIDGPKMLWYVHNLSISDETMISIQPYYKDKLKRMNKEEKKRRSDAKKKIQEKRIRKFNGERIEEEEDNAALITPTCYTSKIPYPGCWTSLGSTIYCFGSRKGSRGGSRFCNEVRFYSLFDLEKGWELGPPMINHRWNGKAVTVEDKIYVFGGTNLNLGPWAEVFKKDDNIGKWMALKEPPFNLPLLDIFASPYADNDRTKILVGSQVTQGLYSYSPIEDSWEVVDEQFRLELPCYTDPVVVEKTLYWVGDETIWAYDFDRKMFFSGHTHFRAVKNALAFGISLQSSPLPLLHIHGDMFLLMWQESDFGRELPRSQFVLHKFRVLKRMDRKEGERSLKVKVVDIEYLLTNHRFSTFNGKLLSDPKEVVMPDEEKEENFAEEEIELTEEEDKR